MHDFNVLKASVEAVEAAARTSPGRMRNTACDLIWSAEAAEFGAEFASQPERDDYSDLDEHEKEICALPGVPIPPDPLDSDEREIGHASDASTAGRAARAIVVALWAVFDEEDRARRWDECTLPCAQAIERHTEWQMAFALALWLDVYHASRQAGNARDAEGFDPSSLGPRWPNGAPQDWPPE